MEKRAYPPPPAPEKKQKKVKNLGDRFPGAKGGDKPVANGSVRAKSDGQVVGDAAHEVSVGVSKVALDSAEEGKKA